MIPKTVLISTFNNSKNNYGAVFQAFALSEKLKTMGYEVSFLTLKERKGRFSSVTKKSVLQQVKQLASNVLSLPTKPLRKRRTQKFNEFVQKTQKQCGTFKKQLVFYEAEIKKKKAYFLSIRRFKNEFI